LIFGPRRIVPVTVALSQTTAVRFTGDQAAIVMTGTAIPVDAVAQVDGVTQGTSVRNSSTQITFTLGKAHTRTAGTKAVRWYSPGTGTSSATTNFTVTQAANLGYEYDPHTGITLGTGSNVASLADISGNGNNLVASAVMPTKASAVMNGRDALAYIDTSHILNSSGLATVMGTCVGVSIFRVIKSTVASVADKGIYGFYLLDTVNSADEFFVGGYSSLLSGETFCVGANGNKRRGTAGYTWTANEMWVEEVHTHNGVRTDVQKNGAAAFTLDKIANSAGFLAPNSATYGTGKRVDMYGSMDSGTQYIGYMIGFTTDLSAGLASEVRAYLGGLFGVTVA
jgi:hypothetical protein